ncbi:MAG: protein kinase [Bryobacteraceae bacterium]|nr:protein kinase [Bryobacteraceae bacterium]
MNPDSICMGCIREHGGAMVCPHCGWREDQAPASPLYLPPRTILADQFMVGRVLGHGGFGILYIAWDLRLHRKLAVKEYMPQGVAGRSPGQRGVSVYTNQADYQWGLDRFLDEARVVARFSDRPDIISVINFFAENDTGYMVTEYLDGRTLLQYVESKGGRIAYEAAVRIMTPVMDALREVHRTGILHRDISPDNIFLTNTGLVKVLDFGAARQALGQKSRNLSVILKEGYAPEEQYRTKGNQGQWTDVYATAATLYRIVTGKVPPPATDRAYHDEIELPSSLGAMIPPAAEAVLMTALSVRAENRYQSMEEFQAALVGERAPVSRAVPVPDPITRPAPAPAPMPPQTVTPVPGPVPAPAPIRKSVGELPKWVWIVAASAAALLIVAWLFRPGRTTVEVGENEDPAAEQPGVDAAASGRWSTGWTDGTTQNECEVSYETDGKYSFVSGCPPALLQETGLIRISDGTFRIISNNSGRKDWGTYRIVEGSRLEMIAPNGTTTVWVRRAPAAPGPPEEFPPYRESGTADSGDDTRRRAARTEPPPTGDFPPRREPDTEAARERSDNRGLPRTGVTPPRIDDPYVQPPVSPPVDNTSPAADTPAALLKKAGELTRSRRANQALPMLQQVLSQEPNNAEAHANLGYIYLYNDGDVATAAAHYRKALDNGGTVSFHLKHDLGDGMFTRFRTGTLRLSKSRIAFTGDDGVPVFAGPLTNVAEAKLNSKVTRLLRGVRAPGSFHIKIGGDNYNLAPMSNFHRQETDLILGLIPGSS